MKILTANIALGIPGADFFWRSARSVFAFHGFRLVPFFLFRGRTMGIFDYSFHSSKRREEYFATRSTLQPILALVQKENPDAIVLNELLPFLHTETIETELRALGFVSFAWGISADYPDLATLVASKLPAEPFIPLIRSLPKISGGNGAAGLRFRNIPLSLVGCQLAVAPTVFRRSQIEDMTRAIIAEKHDARTVIVAGDFNETAKNIYTVDGFRELGLTTVTRQVTCPLGFPRMFRWDLDHIFIPSDWHPEKTKYIRFGSDHLAVLTEVSFT